MNWFDIIADVSLLTFCNYSIIIANISCCMMSCDTQSVKILLTIPTATSIIDMTDEVAATLGSVRGGLRADCV